jgi:hypothetical protein
VEFGEARKLSAPAFRACAIQDEIALIRARAPPRSLPGRQRSAWICRWKIF